MANKKKIFHSTYYYHLQMSDEKDINYVETYKVVEGRKYLNEEDVSYHLPNDEEEFERANLQHCILRYVWQGNFSSKIDERLIKGNTKVIDLGCGTGQWLIDMSLKYPLSTFIGIDISPITHPSQENKPDNVAFLRHNLLDGIPFPDETFDFVYQRDVPFKVESGWTHIIDEIVRVTNLNGCVEISNYDLYKVVPFEGPILNKLHSSFLKLCTNDNVKIPTSTELIGYLNRTNRISDIQIEEKSIPLGWDGRLGELMLLDIIILYRGFKLFLQPLMKITGEEYDNLLNELGNECIKYKPSLYTYRVYGKKR